MEQLNRRAVVIYNSRYGSTRRYAEWIAEGADADILETTSTKIGDLFKYETIIFGGSLHAVGIKGLKLITRNFEVLSDKKIIVFAVGCSPARDEDIKHVISSNFSETMMNNIKFFYLRGAFNYRKLGIVDKTMMNLLRIKLKRMKAPDADAVGLLASYDKPVDWTNKKYIEPIIKYIKKDK